MLCGCICEVHGSQLWKSVQEELEGKVSYPTFQFFFRDSRLVSLEDSKATIAVPTSFIKDYICDNLMETLILTMSQKVNRNIAVRIIVDDKLMITTRTKSTQKTFKIDGDYYSLDPTTAQ